MLLVSLLLVIEGIIRLAEIFNRQTCKAKHLSKNILLKYGKLSVKLDSMWAGNKFTVYLDSHWRGLE